ncbi:DUF192 domain-containing protein [Fusibacter tunisiensis]|uniref:Uncharacterized membrane protein (UPF0127 family) n=1 Tax=Fusibacter tunisiensis TaxID=1008308 RepID=A0ABS2MNQ9_9FIRM|nr:DUF192 domain-containing protein [Fusibacter tunisiensis]MBM7561030.1 uncharacterized membrane protein (UPF0127 family) [Fusibacter tunisiensis]
MQIIKVDTIVRANTFIKRLKGYMFVSKPNRREVLLIEPCNQVHTFNMKFEIDVLYLDINFRVLAKFEHVKAGRVLPAVKESMRVAEGGAGLFKRIVEGEIVRFEI